jgi:hypothetical protein
MNFTKIRFYWATHGAIRFIIGNNHIDLYLKNYHTLSLNILCVSKIPLIERHGALACQMIIGHSFFQIAPGK